MNGLDSKHPRFAQGYSSFEFEHTSSFSCNLLCLNTGGNTGK